MQPTREWIRRLPKVELHVHLDGSLRPSTMLELAGEARCELPARDREELAERMLVRDASSLEEYLDRYRYTVALLQTEAALCRVAWDLVTDVAAESVRHVEVRFCPALHPGVGDERAVEAVLEGLRRGERDTGCTARLIVCGLRTLAPSVSVRMARVAARYRDAGVVGFDLAGAERGHPAGDHAGAFAVAREAGLGLTCHAGEADGPQSVRQALDLCGAQRIGHGTRLHEDPALEESVREAGIPLEVCVTSNVHTRAVPDAPSHPLRRYVRRGMVVTLNTDGRLMDGVTLSDEYRLAHEQLGLDAAALARLALDAARSSFGTAAEKRALVDRLEREIDAIPLGSSPGAP